jgi:molecular chaperone GrpE
MTQEEKKPLSPEDTYPELEDEEALAPNELEELIEAATSASAEPATDSTQMGEGDRAALLAKLQQECSALQQRLQEKEESYLRLYADFDNFRKRTQREKEELGHREKQKSILEILPIVDNFERAQHAIKLETDGEKAIHESYQSVYRLLVESLKKMGVARMKTVGQPFDPTLHEAMMQQPSADHPEGTVLMEFQPGYLLGEFVLRHAMVTVATPPEGGSEAASSPATAQPEGVAPSAADGEFGSEPAPAETPEVANESSPAETDDIDRNGDVTSSEQGG